MRLAGGSAVITGGAGMLGFATAQRLADAGMHVVCADLAPGGTTADPRIQFVRADATVEADVESAARAAAAAGPLRVFVACAGGGLVQRTLARDGTRHSLADFRAMLELNLVSAFVGLEVAAAVMAEQEPDDDGVRGVVVLVSSLAGLEASAGQIAYGAAKAGVAGLTLPAARDLAPVGVRVMTIAPGGMARPGEVDLEDPRIAGVLGGVLHPKRFGKPEEFAHLVQQIVELPYLNGTVIRLDGGARLGLKH